MENKISEKLCELRREHGMSQEELAEKLLVSRQAISKWERGEALPDTENLIALARLYEVSLDELCGIDNNNGGKFTVEISSPYSKKKSETHEQRSALHTLLDALPYPIVVTIAFLLWGFIWDGWSLAWILYVTIPVYYSIVDAVRSQRLCEFNFPVFITVIYLFLGMNYGLWHPGWVLYTTIPVFYCLAEWIDKRSKK